MGLKTRPQSVAALGSTGRTADSGAAILRELTNTVAAGQGVVLVTVVATNRSVPRHAGAKMLVFADGRTSGTIGGGEMEARVVREATVAMVDGRTRSLDISLVDPGRGDPGVCGGDVHLYLEPYMPVPTVFVVGCGHVGKAVVTLAKWLGFRVVATDDRPELVSADELPMADERHTGLVSEALDLHPITAETHVVVVTRNAGIDKIGRAHV